MTERKPNRGWIWYFVALVALTILATTILFVYNRSQELKPERLEAMRKLWEEKRPADYVLTYTKTGDATGTFVVTVRQGKVVSVIMREEVKKDNETQVVEQPLEPRQYHTYDMEGLFDNIERFLELASMKDSPRVYLAARFDPTNGQLRQFTRAVLGTGQHVRIDVEPIQTPPPGPGGT